MFCYSIYLSYFVYKKFIKVINEILLEYIVDIELNVRLYV